MVAILARSYTATQDFRKQVARHAKRHPDLAREYEHLWFICKRPHLCDRCRGWLAGVGTVIGGWLLSLFFYGFSPSSIANVIGTGWATLLGAVLLFTTPISGTLGRMGKLDKDSFWESPYALGMIGFLNALSAPILVSVAFKIVLH
jgi:hypothetical protein